MLGLWNAQTVDIFAPRRRPARRPSNPWPPLTIIGQLEEWNAAIRCSIKSCTLHEEESSHCVDELGCVAPPHLYCAFVIEVRCEQRE